MKTYTSIQTEAMSAITCDRCQATFSDGDDGWTETLLIEYTAGYGSIFGDGNTVAIDLCQDCLKQTLGKWLRVGDHRSREKATKDGSGAHAATSDSFTPESVRGQSMREEAVCLF